jgi:hypothetical protein
MMSKVEARVEAAVPALTLVLLGVTTVAFFRGDDSVEYLANFPFVAWLVAPWAGLACLTINVKGDQRVSDRVLLFTLCIVGPQAAMFLLHIQGDMGLGFVLTVLSLVEWIFIAVVGIARFRSLESERRRNLRELWLARPPDKRTSGDIVAFCDDLERHRPELLRQGSDKYDELRFDLGLDEAGQSGVDQQRSLLR